MNSTPRWLHLKTEAGTVDKQYSSAAATDTPVGAAAGDTLQIPALLRRRYTRRVWIMGTHVQSTRWEGSACRHAVT